MDLQSKLDMAIANAPEPEVAQQEPQTQEPQENTNEVEAQEQETEQVGVQPVQQEESVSAKNFRVLREKTERLEWENREYQRKELQRLQEEELRRSKPVQQEDDSNIADDDYTAKKDVEKIFNKKNKVYEERINKLEQMLVEKQLKEDYPDFDNVVTDENMKKLAAKFPHHVRNLSYSPNYYDRAAAAYELITDKKINAEVEQEHQTQVIKQKIQNNLNRTKSAATVASSATSSALARAANYTDELTPERKQQLWKEMQDTKRRSGF
jgi:hypothetical protein